MHIPDGVLHPAACLGTAALSAAAVGYALRQARRDASERDVPLMGVSAACLFAAQLINFYIPGGTSGHIVGGVLAAVLLGPWAAQLVLVVVLLVQCVLFQDGGLTALGANVLNMAVVGAGCGYAIYALVRRRVGGLRGIVAGAVIAAWFSVMAAATLASFELAVGGNFRLGPTLGAMLTVHSVIGVGEALATGLALAFVLRVRPDLVYGRPGAAGALARTGQLVGTGLLLAIVMAGLVSPFASSLPDGLEASLASLGFDVGSTSATLPAPFADYSVPALAGLGIAGSVAGILGTLVVFGLAIGLARRWPQRPSPHHV